MTHEHDPIELDRLLDGELSPDEAAALRARIERDPDARAQRAARERFLAYLAEAGQAHRDGVRAAVPAGLETRVRDALRDRAARPRRWMPLAAAAAVLAAVGAFAFLGGGGQAEAVPAPVRRALAFARAEPPGERGTCSEALGAQSAVIRSGDFAVTSCSPDGSTARVQRLESLPAVWAAVPAPGVNEGPVIGLTRLEEHVVFDVRVGRKHEYLIVGRALFDALREHHGERTSCFVCHNRSRDGLPNPHRIAVRSWGERAE